jgi:hypothetical protein
VGNVIPSVVMREVKAFWKYIRGKTFQNGEDGSWYRVSFSFRVVGITIDKRRIEPHIYPEINLDIQVMGLRCDNGTVMNVVSPIILEHYIWDRLKLYVDGFSIKEQVRINNINFI